MYYDALQASQQGWYEGTEDVTPFIKYLLMTILAAYRDFEERVEIVSEKASAVETVRLAIKKKVGKFKKSDIVSLCPALSVSAIEKSLNELMIGGAITKHGMGKNTYYTRNS